MSVKVQLNNFRFSIYIDADGTVTLTDLPPELREVAEALDPLHIWGTMCPIPPLQEAPLSAQEGLAREATAKDHTRGEGCG
jgi:hypothetical protein